MILNIKNDGVVNLADVFERQPKAFDEYVLSQESLTIVEGDKILAEIKPWYMIKGDQRIKNLHVKFSEKNKHPWIPFALMVIFKYAKLFDPRFRFFQNNKEVKVTKL